MGQVLKAPKGEITISNVEGRIRLRWRLNGERYSLNLPYPYSSENMHHAAIKVAEINLDILRGSFDPSLERYKPPAIVKPTKTKLVEKLLPEVNSTHFLFLNDLVGKFNHWGNNIRNIDVENSIDYLYTRKLLEKWVNVPIEHIAEKLNAEDWVTTTYNRRLHYLKTFFTWLLTNGIISHNYLVDVCRKKDKEKKKNPKRRPLEVNEILEFLEAIKNDTHCPKASRFKHSHYYPFLALIFYTGVRNAEAIGIREKHIDFASGKIEISEALARTIKGSHHSARKQKGTKTENIRYLVIDPDIKNLLLKQVEGKKPNDLVFPSPRGVSIDDRMFQRRIMKPVFIKMKMDIRDLYAARHSFGTRAIQQGMALTDVAYLMGHSTIETAARNYVSVERPAITLPTIRRS